MFTSFANKEARKVINLSVINIVINISEVTLLGCVGQARVVSSWGCPSTSGVRAAQSSVVQMPKSRSLSLTSFVILFLTEGPIRR